MSVKNMVSDLSSMSCIGVMSVEPSLMWEVIASIIDRSRREAEGRSAAPVVSALDGLSEGYALVGLRWSYL